MKSLIALALFALAAILTGCAGPKVSPLGMEENTSGLKKIAVASLLKQKITIHDITLPIGPAESSMELPGYDINNRVEQALANRVTANGRVPVRLQPSDRERLVELKQTSYLAYPNYNSNLKPLLAELRTNGIDALLVISPFKYIMFKDEPNPLAPGNSAPVEGYGLYYGAKNLRAVYLTATLSLYLTDDPAQKRMYYIRPRLFRDLKLSKIPYAKGILKGGPRFTDYPADEQARCLSELDQVIEEELTKNLAALGL